MLRVFVLLLGALLACPAAGYAQAGTASQSTEPFKVGTFMIGNTQTVGIVLLVGDDQRQQADASDMIHSVWEVIEYASSLVTLQPGDIVGAGTSGGVGMGTSVRGSQVWLVDGDEISATIDGIGTLQHKVQAAPPPPSGTGSYLPPVSSYRGQGRGGRGGGPGATGGGGGRGTPGN